jgi:hypothetical protein
MSIDLNSIIVECQEQRIQGFNDYIAVDQEAGTRFLSTKKQGDFKGGVVLRIVEQKLNFSEPLRRAMSHTTSAAGTKTWREHGMNMSWHYHPEIGINLSVLIDP